jgi:hypothetical protein
MYAFHIIGIAYRTKFSAFIVTTRNPELDVLLDRGATFADEVTKLRKGKPDI